MEEKVCHRCGTKSNIIIHCFPVEITFPVKKNKTGGVAKRIGDISGQIILDLNTITPATVNKYWGMCGDCGEKVDLEELFDPEIVSCAFCDITTVEYCAYNELMVCTAHYLQKINYCSECPLKNDCNLFRKSRE